MSEEKVFTEVEAHQHFARKLNGETWGLLGKEDRSKEDDELMLYSALASCRHWLAVGTGLHHQRGEWMVSHVYAVLAMGQEALRHAQRCMELTEEHSDLMEDFDWAYAYESVGRANAILGNREAALEYIGLAEKAGQAIADEESKKFFQGDFGGGDWGGLR